MANIGAADFVIKIGDRQPSLQATLWKGTSTTPEDVTGTTVKLVIQKEGSTATAQKLAASIVDGPNGKVRYDWLGTEFSVSGRYKAEWEVTFAGGKEGTFPNDGYFIIKVYDELG